MPWIEEHFPIRHERHLGQDSRKHLSAMVPGYCVPQMLYVFQVSSFSFSKELMSQQETTGTENTMGGTSI